MQKKALITGSNGFVGTRLVSRLREDKDPIAAYPAIRSNSYHLPQNNSYVVGDIGPFTDWSAALSDIDTVVHLAARVHVMEDKSVDPLSEYRSVNVQGTINLAKQAADAGVRRFIYLSSIKVNGEETSLGEAFTEDSVPNPLDPYGISKFEAEEGLKSVCKQTGMEFVIIRPPLIYGPGVKANFLKLIATIKKGIPMPFGCISNQRSMLSLDNLIDFIVLTAHDPRAGNQTFLLSDGVDISSKDLVNEIAKALGLRPRLIPVPIFILIALGFLTGRSAVIQRLLGSLQIDSSKATKLLNWTPPVTVEEGMARTIKAFLIDGK